MPELGNDPTLTRGDQRGAGEIFRGVFDQSQTPTALTDLEGRALHVNKALCELTGSPVAELLQGSVDDLIHADDRYADCEQLSRLLADGEPYRIEQRYITSGGSVKWCQKAVGVLRAVGGTPVLLVVHLEDISARKLAEERLQKLADIDALTGLRNRRVFEDDLGVQVSRCKRYGEQAALLVIDIDAFKQINDSYGHGTGDKVLSTVAETILKRVRSSDLAARLGGDEFAVLLSHVDGDTTKAVLEDLRAVLAKCAIESEGAIIEATASIGAAVLDGSTLSGAAALHEADTAMYRAKRARGDSEQSLLTGDAGPLLAA